MFGFLKKKKEVSMPELPPPPSPPEFPMPEGDIPSIRPGAEIPEELPELPEEMPEEVPVELPEIPSPGMPSVEAPELPEHEELEHIEPLVPETEEEMSIEEPIHAERAPELAPVEEEIPERETVRRPVGPAFVSVDEYRNIMEHSERVRAKLSEAEEFAHRLGELKADEEKTFDKWRSQLEEIERRLGQIERVIAKAKR